MKEKPSLFTIICAVILIALVAWIVGSWIEVICKNVTPNPEYWEYNVFNLLAR